MAKNMYAPANFQFTTFRGNKYTADANGLIANVLEHDIQSLAAGGASIVPPYMPPLGFVANNCSFPVSWATSTAPVNTTRSPHKSGPTGFRGIWVGYVNAYLGTNQESNGRFDFKVRMGININGVYTRGYVNGDMKTIEDTCVKAWGLSLFYIDVYIPPNTDFFIETRREATDSASSVLNVIGISLGTTTTISYDQTADADPANGDSIRFASVGGTTQLNYATNGSVAYTIANLNAGAKTFQITNSSGVAIDSSAFGAYSGGGTTSREYSWPYNTVGTIVNGGGNISQTYAASVGTDYTLGVGLPGGVSPATILPLTASQIDGSGNCTGKTKGQVGSAPLNGVGALYTTGLNVAGYYGAAGVNQPGSLYKGTTAIGGYTFNSSGLVNSFSSSTGSGADAETPPPLFLGGGGGYAGATTAIWGPQFIMGTPEDDSCPSVFIVGDSTQAYGSADTTGDINGNIGSIEQAIANRAGVCKFAVSGESLSGFLSNSTNILALLKTLYNFGLRIDFAPICLGINDFGTTSIAGFENVVAGRMSAVIELLTNAGVSKCLPVTVPPHTTGTYTTLGGQSAVTVGGDTLNYGSGGRVQVYNNYIRQGVVIRKQAGYIDLAKAWAAPSPNDYKFRVDGQFYLQYSTAVAFTNDGIHGNMGAGIPYAAMWLDLRALGISNTPVNPRTRIARNARNGEIGQIIKSVVPVGSAVTLTTATAKTVATLQLPEGIWQIGGQIDFALAAASASNLQTSISQVTDTLSTTPDNTLIDPFISTTLTATKSEPLAQTPPLVVQVGKVATINAVAQATFSAGAVTAFGTLYAVRVGNPI